MSVHCSSDALVTTPSSVIAPLRGISEGVMAVRVTDSGVPSSLPLPLAGTGGGRSRADSHAHQQRRHHQACRDDHSTERTGRQSGAGHSRDAIRAHSSSRAGRSAVRR